MPIHHHDTKGVDFGTKADSYDAGLTGAVARYCYRVFLSVADIAEGATVLDAGCGTGALLQLITERFRAVGIGVEMSPQMAEVARNKHPGLKILTGVAAALPVPDASVDAVVACLAYHHFEDQPAFLREAARILRDGGTLYLVEANLPKPFTALVNTIFAHQGHFEKLYTASRLCTELMDAGWVVTQLHDGLVQVVKATFRR